MMVIVGCRRRPCCVCWKPHKNFFCVLVVEGEREKVFPFSARLIEKAALRIKWYLVVATGIGVQRGIRRVSIPLDDFWHLPTMTISGYQAFSNQTCLKLVL